MNLSADMKKRLLDEIAQVAGRMKGYESPVQKLYFFSGVYGMARHIANLEYHPELIFMEQVMQLAYGMINARLTAMAARQEAGVTMPPGLFSSLEKTLEELAEAIEQGTEVCPALQKMVNLAYSTTGNGYYLYLKGVLRV